MARIFAVEEWLRSWVVGDFTVLEPARDITDIDHLCDFLVKDLKNKATGDDGLLVVCADWKPFETSRRYEQNGVRLLKHLRLTPELGDLRRMHAVVLSFEPVEELIRRTPGSLVLLSRGVTFLRLPEGLESLKDETFLAQRATAHADLRDKDLLAAVRADYRPPDSAHSISNWWGVHQIWRARDESGLNREAATFSLPEVVGRRLRELRNKEALCLETAGTQKSIPDDDLNELGDLEDELYLKGPRILLLDDEASIGWGEIFRSALSSRHVSTDELDKLVIVPAIGADLDEAWLRRNVIERHPYVVLLDLRLKGAAEADAIVAETSGAKVLQTLRTLDWGLPVILMTASNKYWTYQEVRKLGADGYWMKEGIGEHRPPVSAAKHLSNLLRLILNCVGDRMRDLRLFSNALRLLKNREHLWWLNAVWDATNRLGDQLDPDQIVALRETQPERERVFALFESALGLYRSYLQTYELSHDFVAHSKPSDAAMQQCSAIGLAAGKVIEEIHCFSTLAAAGLPANRMSVGTYRKDTLGAALYLFRSRCAHVHLTSPGIDEVRDYLALLLAYLAKKPNRLVFTREKLLSQYFDEAPSIKRTFQNICGRSELVAGLGATSATSNVD